MQKQVIVQKLHLHLQSEHSIVYKTKYKTLQCLCYLPYIHLGFKQDIKYKSFLITILLSNMKKEASKDCILVARLGNFLPR